MSACNEAGDDERISLTSIRSRSLLSIDVKDSKRR